MANVLYICGLGHSGSTLLDLLLSGHPRVFGLGEARMVTHPGQREPRLRDPSAKACSCGQSMSACRLWGEFLTRTEKLPGGSFQDWYGQLVAAFDDVCGADSWLSDSSKGKEGLAEIVQMYESGRATGSAPGGIKSLQVIHLVRDVRSYASSHLARNKQQGIFAATRVARFWKSKTLEHQKFLESLNVPILTLGYEELCISPEFAMQTVAHFLDIPFDSQMVKPSPRLGHVATGNPMRLDSTKSQALLYDNRWFFRNDIGMVYQMYPGLASVNEAMTYANTRPGLNGDTFQPPVATTVETPIS